MDFINKYIKKNNITFMSNFKKTFSSFINEELNKETYLSASDKLNKLGHGKRAEELEKYAKSKDESTTITINGVEYSISESSVKVNDKFNTIEFILTDIEEARNQRTFTIKYTGNKIDVLGLDGLTDRKDANKLFKFIKTFINNNVDKYPKIENLLTILRVNNLYK